MDELEHLKWDDVPAGNRTIQTKNGRRAIHTLKSVSVATRIIFPHATQAMQIARKSPSLGSTKWHVETVHALRSLPAHLAGPRELGAWVQGRWGLVNGLH